MSKQWKHRNLYKQKYPHYLPWHKALWITKPDDTLIIDSTPYKVVNVELSSIMGSVPKVTVEPLINQDE